MEGYKTYVGIAVAALGAYLQTKGVDMGDPTPYVNAILQFGGLAMAVYGRAVAKPT